VSRTERDVVNDTGAFPVPDLSARPNLRQQIGRVLRAAMITGEMRPGHLYSAPQLAERFGVSVTPVREALLDLAGEGLVETVRNKGYRTTRLTDTDLDRLTALRALIEVPTVRAVAADPAVRARAEGLREAARAVERHAVDGDLIAFVEADRLFHAALLGLSGNTILVETVTGLRQRSRLYNLRSLADRGELAASAREHEELVDLVLAGRADEAEALMRRHIGHVRGAWASRGHEETS